MSNVLRFGVAAVVGLVLLIRPTWGQKARVLLNAKGSEKLAPELVAARLSGGTLIGRTGQGEAVVESNVADAVEARSAANEVSGLVVSDAPVPGELDESGGHQKRPDFFQ